MAHPAKEKLDALNKMRSLLINITCVCIFQYAECLHRFAQYMQRD
jgi:hypothetical protein